MWTSMKRIALESELETGLKKYEELVKIVENHSKQLNEVKTKQISIICMLLIVKTF